MHYWAPKVCLLKTTADCSSKTVTVQMPFLYQTKTTQLTRMALSRMHTSTKATDPAKVLLLSKLQVKHMAKYSTGVADMPWSCRG